MPFVTTIIARLLALEDWYLAQFVDVSTVSRASPNGCWSFDVQNATLNACGQALLGNATGGWDTIMNSVVALVPNLVAALAWTGPYGNWTPYIPPTP